MIFSRSSGRGGRHSADEPKRSSRYEAEPGPDNARTTGIDDGPSGAVPGDAGARAEIAVTVPGGRTIVLDGPYDVADAPADLVRVDLGSLQVPQIDGVEVRVQANAEGVIQQVVLGYDGSALQLGAFAAPRNEGIWDEVRSEIRKSLFDDGVAVEELPGDHGLELRAQVRSPEGLMDLRFIGVDGPRWMVRAVYQGPAAADTSLAGPLAVCLRGLVVDRGRDAMPVRDALPLRLPREVEEQVRAQQAEAEAAAALPADRFAAEQAAAQMATAHEEERRRAAAAQTAQAAQFPPLRQWESDFQAPADSQFSA